MIGMRNFSDEFKPDVVAQITKRGYVCSPGISAMSVQPRRPHQAESHAGAVSSHHQKFFNLRCFSSL